MSYWVTPTEMAGLDRIAIARGTPGEQLMEAAGEKIADIAKRMIPSGTGPIEVWVGPGNNGGDGFVAARLLRRSSPGYDVRLIATFDESKKLSDESFISREKYINSGGEILNLGQADQFSEPPVLVIDGLLGTGLRGKLKGDISIAAGMINSRKAPLLAIDTPSGINGETGEVDALTTSATATVTFACCKIGLLLPPGCAYTGTLFVAPIGIAAPSNPKRLVMDVDLAREMLPERPVDAHKGNFGRLLLIGGSEEMPGAPLLMTLGALHAGVGLVNLCVPLPAAPSISAKIPEALYSYFLPGDVTSIPEPAGFDAAAIGPGMGNDTSTRKIVRNILSKWKIPLLLDADALNCLGGDLSLLKSYKSPLVLTPHPGELRGLTGSKLSGLKDGWSAATDLSESTGAIVLLKGRPTAIFAPSGKHFLIPTGNNGLATGGSGDVLTGIIASFLAQGVEGIDAAALGSFVHGISADILTAEKSARSILPSDVARTLGKALAMIEDRRNSNLLRIEGKWNGFLWHHP